MVKSGLVALGMIFFYVLSLMPAYAQEEKCTEFWICTDWSFCLGSGVQIRSCYDMNRCGTEREKPNETEACSPPAVRDIVLPEKESPGVTGMLISNTPTLLGIVAVALGVAAYILYRKWKDLRMFISPP